MNDSQEHAEGRRLEVLAAWVMGAALPLLETLRRRTDFSNLPAYIDDFLWGGLLLWAVWSVSRRRWYGNGLLAAAWGILCGAMYYSFFGQLAHPETQDISGLPSTWVALAKAAFLGLAIVCVFLSVRHLRPEAQ